MSSQHHIESSRELTAVKIKRGSRWLFITGILTILIGSIHEAATPFIFKGHSVPPDSLYMFLSTGAAVFFMGALIIYCSRMLKQSERSAWAPAVAAGVYLLLAGIGAILVMPANPFSYLMFIVAFLELMPLFIYRREFRHIGPTN